MYWNRMKNFFIIHSHFSVNILILINLLLAGVAFIKDVLLAHYFGTSVHGDSLYIAFFLPDTIGNNLLAAAIGLSCIPVFTKASKKDGSYERSVYMVIILSILLSLLFILLLLPSSKWLFTHVNFDVLISEPKITNIYFLIMLPIVMISPLSIIAVSILQASDQFIKPAFMPVIFNAILLLVILICVTMDIPLTQGGYLFSGTTLLSTAVITVIAWAYVLKQVKFPLLNPFTPNKENHQMVYEFLKIFMPYFFILLSQQSIFLFERYIASTLETGTVSGLTYAFRISQFPIWVFIAAINTVLLPTIAKLTHDRQKLQKELKKSFVMIMLISLMVSILFFSLSEWLIAVLFLRGAFDYHSLQITSDIFKGYALSLLGQSVYLFCLRYFVANGKMLFPFLICLCGSVIQIFLIFMFAAKLGAPGIGYAAAVGYTLTGGILFFQLYRDISKGNAKAVEMSNE
jgi:putative peptidoglycan lipid II flippase